MKTYGDLQLRLDGLTPDEFGDRTEAVATNGWTRDRTREAETKRTGGGQWLTYALSHHPTLPPSYLFLTGRSPGLLYVANIISPARDRLAYDEYNAILKSFGDDVLARVQPPGAIHFDLSGTDIELSTQLSPSVFERLQFFSTHANKRTGSGHPFDRRRWLDFLIATVDAQADLDSHTLTRWLEEDGGWDAEQASRLADEYEFGRELLERRKQAS